MDSVWINGEKFEKNAHRLWCSNWHPVSTVAMKIGPQEFSLWERLKEPIKWEKNNEGHLVSGDHVYVIIPILASDIDSGVIMEGKQDSVSHYTAWIRNVIPDQSFQTIEEARFHCEWHKFINVILPMFYPE